MTTARRSLSSVLLGPSPARQAFTRSRLYLDRISLRVVPMKKLIPVLLVLATACNSSGDSTGTKAPPSDISTMTVGEVRVLNPSDIPNGIDLPSGSSARDYVIIVGNTNPTIDAVANFVVKADRSAGGSSDLSASAELNSGLNRASQAINSRTPPQQAFETKVRMFERQHSSTSLENGYPRVHAVFSWSKSSGGVGARGWGHSEPRRSGRWKQRSLRQLLPDAGCCRIGKSPRDPRRGHTRWSADAVVPADRSGFHHAGVRQQYIRDRQLVFRQSLGCRRQRSRHPAVHG